MDQENKNDKGIDLSGALDNSSNNGGLEGRQRYTRSYEPGTPKVVQWIINHSGNYIKDEKQASYVVLGFVALMIIISLFLVFGGGKRAEIKAPAGQKVLYPQGEPPRLQQPF